MARFYSNENIALPVVVELRKLGHDVLTSIDAGKANAAVPDVEVLGFAASEKRILLTNNGRHFLSLHNRRETDHEGLELLTFDADFVGQAGRIDRAEIMGNLKEFESLLLSFSSGESADSEVGCSEHGRRVSGARKWGHGCHS